MGTDPQRADFPEAKQLLKSTNQTPKEPTDRDEAEEASQDEELTRHFISRWEEQRQSARAMAQMIQSHWCCESRHWQRDACWGEDRCRLRSANAACALALIHATMQSLVHRAGRQSLPAVFEDVAHDLSLGLGWLRSRHFHS